MDTAQLIKLRSIAFVRKLKEQQTTKSTENIVHDPSGQNYRPGTTTSKVSPEIILQKDRTLDVSDRLANEIKNKGITCHIVREIGSIQFEEKSCYSHLFPMSPRIITNRGYIRLVILAAET
jgi:hypothetical protein